MSKKIKITFTILVIVAILAIIVAINFALEVQKLKSTGASGAVISQEEVERTVEEVGEYMVLPEGETPTMATVSDPSQLKDQPFFANAVAGDVVLIYATSRKAILWRPSTKKIVEVSPINLPTPEADAGASARVETVPEPEPVDETPATSTRSAR